MAPYYRNYIILGMTFSEIANTPNLEELTKSGTLWGTSFFFFWQFTILIAFAGLLAL